jgi:mannonate dehydratase
MKIGLVVMPSTEVNLRRAAQIGVTDIVYYDMTTMPDRAEVLFAEKRRIEGFDMRLSVVEGGPPKDRIILHKDGRDEQIEYFKRCLDAMGKAGIRTLCYDWMPPKQGVIRTSFDHRVRGGAVTSSWDSSKFDNSVLTDEGRTTDEQMWDDLEYFLRRVIPAAESAEVHLAMHPDDPPLSPLQGLARIMRSPAAFDRLFEIAPSECNGMTFCQGCFAEMGVDISETVRHFAPRIKFAHFRDVRGDSGRFHETFQDDGKTDMAAAMRAYAGVGFDGVIRPDHVPLLEGVVRHEADEGYTMLGRLFAVGYMRGLMQACGIPKGISA